jgi:hypothetical protein
MSQCSVTHHAMKTYRGVEVELDYYVMAQPVGKIYPSYLL